MRSALARRLAAAAALFVLAGCEGSTVSAPLPSVIRECEVFSAQLCGTWTLSGDRYVAAWEDGSSATLTVVRFSRTELEVKRAASAGKPAITYTGRVDGKAAGGSVTRTEGGATRTGMWAATW